MARPLFGTEKEVTICDDCGDRLVIPPGVYYDDMKLHKHCWLLRRRQDISEEVIEPQLDRTEEEIQSLLENMEPMETPDWPY